MRDNKLVSVWRRECAYPMIGLQIIDLLLEKDGP